MSTPTPDDGRPPDGAPPPAPAPRRLHGSALPIAALVFVALCLLALAVTPILMTERLAALRDRSGTTTAVAADLLSDLRLLLAEELVVHQFGRDRAGPDAAAFTAYESYRADEDRILAWLDSLGPRIDPAMAGELATLRTTLVRWHALPDARARRRMTDAEFVARLPSTRDLRDSVLASHARADSIVSRAEERNRQAGEHAVTVQRTISWVLGGCAVLALGLLTAIGRRERQLAHALADAAEAEGRLRAQSEQRREDLVRINASKGRLVRGFTHDVKNPIGAADGYLQLVEDGIMGPLTERQAASIARARRAIRSALALIGDLLEVAKAESGHLQVECVPTDVAAVASEVAEEFRAQAESKGLALTVEAEPVPMVESDPARVRQVIGNLLSNAVKYTPHGSVTVRVAEQTGRRTTDGARYVTVEVEDTGPGIPEEKRRLLFQEFTRLDPAAAPGVGIGLAMSHRITEALGGRLGVGGEPGRGSTFTLSLPLVMGAPLDGTATDGTGARALAHDL